MIQTVLVGFIVGLCISYSGVGAGSLTTPLIVFFLGYDASTAIGSDLLFSLGTKVVALLTHVRAQTINYRALAWLSTGGVPGAIVGVLITGWLHAHFPLGAVNHVLKIALGVALLIAALAVYFGRAVGPVARDPHDVTLPRVPLALTGLIVGTMVSITSIGSGSLTLPLLLLVLSQAQLRSLVGTDVAFAVVLLVPALVGHFRIGDVNVHLGLLLLAGSIPGVLVGTPLAKRLPERAFRAGLSAILVVVGIRLFF